jgi:hypothetical protein
LLREHGGAWLGPLAEYGGRLGDDLTNYRRGFLQDIDLALSLLAMQDALGGGEAWAWVESMALTSTCQVRSQ